MGIILLCANQIFNSLANVFIEKFFISYEVIPMKACGMRGTFAFFYCVIILTIFKFISCNISEFCRFGVLEDSILGLQVLSENGILILLQILAITINMAKEVLSLNVIKKASATAKTTIKAGSSGVVWIVFLIAGTEIFNFVQFVGFVLLSFGVLYYNEIIVFKCFGLDKYTKNNLKK